MRASRILATGITLLAVAALDAFAVMVHYHRSSVASSSVVDSSVVHYVALGDSYASGLGAGATTGSCDQSPAAYPALWAKANSPASFTFAACEGATTSDVINSQLSALSSSTTLVSITIGGNDLGFAQIVGVCALQSTSACVNFIASAGRNAGSTLPAKLDTTLADVRSHAPNARIIVVGYPAFYDLNAQVCRGLSRTQAPLSRADHQALDNGINVLDGFLKTAAAKNGATFVDVRPRFSANEVCSGSSWLDPIGNPPISSFHPTAVGQKNGYLPLFTAAVNKADT